MKATFQNKVSTSKLTLPIVSLCGIVSCLLYGVISKNLLPQSLLLALSTVLVVFLNRTYSLIRVYSRTVSCSFILLSMVALPLINDIRGCIFEVFFICFYLTLFSSYQERSNPSLISLIFSLVGIASIFFIQILFIVPVLWIVLGTTLMAGSIKNYLASIVGLLSPYWIWFCWAISFGDITLISNHLEEIVSLQRIDLGTLSNHYLWILIFILCTGLFVSLHFFQTSFEDKIKTRMLFNTLVIINAALVIFLFLQPQHEEYILRMMIISISPLLGHSVTFSKSRFSNYVFIAYLMIALGLIGYNIWIS